MIYVKYEYNCHFFFCFLFLSFFLLLFFILNYERTFLLFLFLWFLATSQKLHTYISLYVFFFFWQPANHGARPNVAKYVIVLTDGRSNDNSKTVQAAMALHNVPNVTVIAIGIGRAIDVNELHIIATDRNHSFVVNNFDLLHTLEVELVDKTCTRELSPFD